MALPSAVANFAYNPTAAEDLEVGSPPSPLREHERAPPSDGGSAFQIGSVSEAGGLAAMQGRLDAAHATIAELSLQLGLARAQLASATELREMAVKFAALDEKHAAQIEINELKDFIYSMKLDWAQWEADKPPAQPEAGMASEVGPDAELL